MPAPDSVLRISRREFDPVEIRHVPRRSLSPDYLAEREHVWSQRLEETTRLGKQLWNGELYTIEALDGASLTMSTCEFKDVVFRIATGVKEIEQRWGPGHVPHFATADCIPVTRDGKLVFGVRGATTNVPAGKVGLIGGTLNCDERTIDTFADIVESMRAEVAEETPLDCPDAALELFSLNHFNANYEFLFAWRLDIDAAAVRALATRSEFATLLALDVDEALAVDNGLDAFRFAKTFLRDLHQQFTTA